MCQVHYFWICVTDFREKGLFWPPLSVRSPKKALPD